MNKILTFLCYFGILTIILGVFRLLLGLSFLPIGFPVLLIRILIAIVLTIYKPLNFDK